MEEVYQSRFISIDFDLETGIFHKKWNAETIEMVDADFVNEMNEQLVLSTEYRPQLVLDNCLNMRFSIPLALQSWLDQVVLPGLIASGLKKIAFVPSADLITELSLKQAMEGETGQLILWDFFSSSDKAQKWLLSSVGVNK